MAEQLSHILIVEQDHIDWDRLEQVIQANGFSCRLICAQNWREALAMSQQQTSDLILLTLTQAEPVGLKLLRQFRKQAPKIAILVVVEAGEEILAGEAMSLGADDFLVRLGFEGYLTLLPYFLKKNLKLRRNLSTSQAASRPGEIRSELAAAEHEQHLLAETLAEVTLALTSQTRPEAVLSEILRQVKRIVPYNTANIMLLEGDTLRPAAWQGYEVYGSDELLKNLILPLSDFLIDAEAVESQQILIIPDTDQDPRWIRMAATDWIRSFASIPICVGDALLGLLRLDADQPNFFSRERIEQLQPLANAAAIALQNARLLEFARQEVAERRRAEVALQYQLDLEQLITKIFIQLINLPPEELDRAIDEALQAIGEFIDADRSYIFLLSSDRRQVEKTHEWCVAGVAGGALQLSTWILSCSTWFADRFERFETVHLPHVADLSDVVASDRAIFESIGIRSMAMIPMEYGGLLIGFLGFDTVSEKKIWSGDTINLLKIVGEILVNAVEHKRAQKALSESELRYKTLFNNAPVAIFTKDCHGYYTSANADLSSYSLHDPVGRTDFDLLPEDIATVRQIKDRWVLETGRESAFEEQIQTRSGLRTLFSRVVPLLDGSHRIVGTLGISLDITERKRRERELETILTVTTALRALSAPEQIMPVLLDQLLNLLDVDGAALVMRGLTSHEIVVELARGAWANWTGTHLTSDSGIDVEVILNNINTLEGRSIIEHNLPQPDILNNLQVLDGVPLIVEKETIGALWVGHENYLPPEIERLLTAISQIAANTIHRTLLYERTEHNLKQIAALREIDSAIVSSLKQETIFRVLFDQLVSLLGVDATLLLNYDAEAQMLTSIAGQGFQSSRAEDFRFPLQPHQYEWLKDHRKTLTLTDLIEAGDAFGRAQLLADEQFVTYFGVPLVTKGQFRGLLEVFHRTPLTPKADWLDLLEAMAGEAAIAIDNLSLFNDLQRSNAELSRVADELRQLIDNANTPIFGVDAAGRINEWNKMVQQLTGYSKANVIGRSLVEEFVAGQDRTSMKAILDQTLAGQETANYELALNTKDGRQVLILLTTTTRRDRTHHIVGVLLMAQDITERNQARAALEAERALLARRVEERTADLSAANAELAQAARLKDEFLASMSHELRTPLNAILGMAEALQDEVYGPFNERQSKALHGIEESGRHLLALISDILDVAKIGAGKLDVAISTVAVESICQASLQLIKQSARKKELKIFSAFDSKVTTLQIDARRLKQILVNLLSNAVKFTPDGGEIGLEVVGDTFREVINFTVWDTGIGISAESMSRLFQPFVQLDSSLARRYSGTGLGLSLVYRMAELLKGSVAVKSTVGIGSRFTVSLPWVRAEMNRSGSTTEADPPELTSFPTLRQVLIIDDSLPTINQLTRYFGDLAIKTTALPESEEIISYVMSVQPDLIVLDVSLSSPPGWEILTRLKAIPETQAIPILIYSEVDEQDRGLASGAAAYLLKPAARQHLYETLDRIFKQASELSDLPSPLPDRRPNEAAPLILLVEDHEENIAAVCDYLPLQGYRPVIARNGLEAIEQVHQERPDLIVLDIQKLNIDGFEMVRRLRSDLNLESTPIVVLTALVMPGDREKFLAAGANEYLNKPVSLKFLVNILKKCLSQPSRRKSDRDPDPIMDKTRDADKSFVDRR